MPESKKRLLLVLDVDGVLIEPRRSFLDAVELTLREMAPKLPWSDEHFEAFKLIGGFNNDFLLVAGALVLSQHYGSIDLLPLLRAAAVKGFPGGLMAEMERAEPQCRGVVQRHYESTRHQEKAMVTLPELKALGFPVAVLTGRPPEEWALAIEVLGFELPAITDSEPKWKKPSPDGLLHWAEHFDAEEIVFAGDNPDDAECLRRALAAMPQKKWTFAAVGPGRDRIMRSGDLGVDSLRDLLKLLDKNV